MNSSTSASSLAPARFAAVFFAVILACVVTVTGFGQWAWQRHTLMKKISPMRYQLALAVAAGPEVRALAVGDSHAALGFRPATPGTMNVAAPSENVAEMRLKLRYLVPQLPNLKLVLLQAQPHQFFTHRSRAPNPPYRYLLEGGPVFHPLERWWDQFDPCCRARVLPMAVLATLDRLPQGYDLDVLRNGYMYYLRFPATAPPAVAPQGDRVPVVDEALVAEYEAMIGDLRRAGIRVVLVGYPLADRVWEAISEAAMREAAARFQAIAQRHQLRICGNWAPMAASLHLNHDHLNPEGARRHAAVIEACAARE